jgi:hypothetical protein
MKEMFEFEFNFSARIKNKSSLAWLRKEKMKMFELAFYFYERTHDMYAFPYTCFSQNIHIDITILKI